VLFHVIHMTEEEGSGCSSAVISSASALIFYDISLIHFITCLSSCLLFNLLIFPVPPFPFPFPPRSVACNSHVHCTVPCFPPCYTPYRLVCFNLEYTASLLPWVSIWLSTSARCQPWRVARPRGPLWFLLHISKRVLNFYHCLHTAVDNAKFVRQYRQS
jgi:hypothetical protein